MKVLEKIERLLKLHGLETAELIHRYHQERYEEQKRIDEAVYGLITVKAHFLDNSLNIQILNARNLHCMDSNGERDIFSRVSGKSFGDVMCPSDDTKLASRESKQSYITRAEKIYFLGRE